MEPADHFLSCVVVVVLVVVLAVVLFRAPADVPLAQDGEPPTTVPLEAAEEVLEIPTKVADPRYWWPLVKPGQGFKTS